MIMVKKRDGEYINISCVDEACQAKCKRTTKISDAIKPSKKDKREILRLLVVINKHSRIHLVFPRGT